jgi:hypothetical protein
MSQILSARPNLMKKDSDGNWYAIPQQEVMAFVQAVERVELAEFLSEEWDQATDELNSNFGCYRRIILL